MTMFDAESIDLPQRHRCQPFSRCGERGPWQVWPNSRRRAICNRPKGHAGDHAEHNRRTAEIRVSWPPRPAPAEHPLIAYHRGEVITNHPPQ